MTEQYAADQLSHLEGLEAVRKRPGMYIGATDWRGINHCAYEIIDNSTDEAGAGNGKRIEVILHADGSVEVTDEGRGIPTGINTKTKMSGVVMALTLLHAGGKFGGSGYKASGGLHGVGSSVVNGLSTRMDAVVKQGGQVHEVSFQHGKVGTFGGDGPNAKFTPGGELKVARKMKKGEATGTSIRYWLDLRYFEDNSEINIESLRNKLRNSAFLVSGVTYVLDDRRANGTGREEFTFANGVADMVDYLTPSTDRPVSGTVLVTGEGSYTENAADENGVMQANVERRMEVEIAFRWSTGYDTTIDCFTNTIPNEQGGSHRIGFDRGIRKAITNALNSTRGFSGKADLMKPEDILEGLTAVIHVRAPEPQFTSQTKDKLSTPGISKPVADLVEKTLKQWLDTKKNKAEARIVLQKIVDAGRVRLQNHATKEAARRKTALEGASMPAKLVDCRSTGTERSELFIVEGDSALGSARSGRIAEYQALLPIRGKILNVHKASMSDILKNNEITAIIQAIGAGSGRTFDIDQMRYGRIMMMADADSDGSHIRVLLIVLFYKLMPEIIKQGRLYAAMPPLHKVMVKGRNSETIYTYTEAEMQSTVVRLEKAGKSIVTPVPRFKGLGEMDAKELWDTTLNPSTRSVRRITIEDVEAAEHLLELAMGSKVPPRKEWIMSKAGTVDKGILD